METLERTFIDKADWPAGEWHNEPDKIQFTDSGTGMACIIRRGPQGALCGYVGVEESHPFFKVGYYDSWCGHDGCYEHKPDGAVRVHGGLTYADLCDGSEAEGICHVPGPGEPEPLWWFGFDCSHAGDMIPRYVGEDAFRDYVYRDITYVKEQCAQLARDLSHVSDNAERYRVRSTHSGSRDGGET